MNFKGELIIFFLDFAKVICDNDELFNELIDQLKLEINEGMYDMYIIIIP